MKNTIKRAAAVLVSLCVLCVGIPTMAFAAPASYEVTFCAGVDGTMEGRQSVTYTVQAKGSCLVPQVDGVDDVHVPTYFTSTELAERGGENASAYPGTSITVDRDVTYVMQYEAQVNTIPYTVQYLDEDGLEIHPSVVGHVASGTVLNLSAPVVEGYTLDDSSSKTVKAEGDSVSVAFQYKTDYTVNEVIINTTTNQYVDDVQYVEAGTTGTGTGAGTGTGEAEGTTPGTEGEEEVEIPDESTPAGPTPESTPSDSSVTIEDESTPMGAGPVDDGSGMSTGMAVGIGAAVVVAIAIIAVLLKKKGHPQA